MHSTSTTFKPRARAEGLVIQELPDEVLVYDLERDKAHCLNQAAAIVWKHCDGETSVPEIAERLAEESGLPGDEELVWLALDQLRRARLLPERADRKDARKTLTRREVMRRIGIGAAIALPIVTSIVAPLAVQAVTCLHAGDTCSTSAECCSGLCSGKCIGG